MQFSEYAMYKSMHVSLFIYFLGGWGGGGWSFIQMCEDN